MAQIMVSEDDFNALVSAAQDAERAGDRELAETLDKLARKVNAAITNGSRSNMAGAWLRPPEARGLSWRDVPSVLQHPPRDA